MGGALSDCSNQLERRFREARAMHGEFGLQFPAFRDRVINIAQAQGASDGEAAQGWSVAKHAADLYLSMACANGEEPAWRRFDHCYRRFIFNVAAFAFQSGNFADDLTSQTMLHLFLPDVGGQRRIGYYDGRSSLATWLRIIVIRRAKDEASLKFNSLESLDEFTPLLKSDGMSKIEAESRASRYEAIVEEALHWACSGLSNEDRRLLLMRYDQGLQVCEIADIFSVHVSTISRKISRVQDQIRKEVARAFALHFHLDSWAIEECTRDAVENPSHSILVHLNS